MKRRFIAAFSGLALALGSAPAFAAPQPPPAPQPQPKAEIKVPKRYTQQEIAWSVCSEPTSPVKVECGLMTAPRDYNNPNAGVDLKIAVSKVAPAEGTADRMVVGNPGGPGGAGLGMAPMLAEQDGLKNHLAVGFDPRGTGKSSNITCKGAPTEDGDPRDRSQAELDLTAQMMKFTAEACKVRSGDLLPYINTEQTVKDIDLIREVLGYETTDYVGYSGGTWMGAYYQKYFPEHAGRFVLDSNTDFTSRWAKTFEAQPQAFERRFREDFNPWAAKYDAQLHLGNTPEKVRQFYEKLRADAKKQPIDLMGIIQVDQNLIDNLIVQSMYDSSSFTELAQTLTMLRDAADGKEVAPSDAQKALLTRTADVAKNQNVALDYRQYADASNATFYAITCNDTVNPKGQKYLDRISGEQGPKYPLVGWSMNRNPCNYWDRPSLNMPTPDGKGVKNTVMVQSENDPATNASLGVDAHKKYAGSRLIWVENEGNHGIYGGLNKCVDDAVNKWLSAGVAPKDMTCEGTGIPAPKPANETLRRAQVEKAGDPIGRAAEHAEQLKF